MTIACRIARLVEDFASSRSRLRRAEQRIADLEAAARDALAAYKAIFGASAWGAWDRGAFRRLEAVLEGRSTDGASR